MKAIVRTEYGTPEVLQLSEIEEPAPTDIEVRVQIHASSINYGDWGLLTGRPFFLRLTEGGLRELRIEILGGDVAGRVEAVGRNTKQFQPGDEVDFLKARCNGWPGRLDGRQRKRVLVKIVGE